MPKKLGHVSVPKQYSAPNTTDSQAFQPLLTSLRILKLSWSLNIPNSPTPCAFLFGLHPFQWIAPSWSLNYVSLPFLPPPHLCSGVTTSLACTQSLLSPKCACAFSHQSGEWEEDEQTKSNCSIIRREKQSLWALPARFMSHPTSFVAGLWRANKGWGGGTGYLKPCHLSPVDFSTPGSREERVENYIHDKCVSF